MQGKKVSQTAGRAAGQWENILEHLGITVPAGGLHGPCPICGGKDRFRFDNKKGRGTWFCNQCGHGDGLDLVKLALSLDTGPAADRVAELLPALPPPAVMQPARKEASDEGRPHDYWQRLFARTQPGESPYLTARGLTGFELPLTVQEMKTAGGVFPAGSLLLPITDTEGRMTGAQLIGPDKVKGLCAGTRKKGRFISVGPFPEKMPARIIISEGFATALSASLLSEGWSIAALDKGNLKDVAEQIRQKWPDVQIVIAGDNDFSDGKPNQGKESAIKAALAVKGWMTIPPGRIKVDWDDYRREFGLQRARDAFAEELLNPADTETRLPHGFRLTKDYLWFDRPLSDGSESGQTRQVKICSPLKVTAITSDGEGGKFGRLLEWEDSSGLRHEWAMPMTVLAGSGQELREVLLDNGMHFISVNGAARSYLMEYISNCRPVRRVTCVEKTGWFSGAYVLQDEVIGSDAGSVILQSAMSSKNDFRVSGTVAEWAQHVGRYCAGNSRLVFCVSLALAAPLLNIIGVGGGGYHLKGESTDGKTTTMKVAASVCGGPDFWKTWRATGNALEGIALRRNDAALMLDEISEVDGREASRIAYMLGNGQGKARGRVDGSVRDPVTWTLLYLSTGEISIAEHAAEAGEKRTGAGVGVRMVQIPSDTGKHGAFENLHGMEGGKAFAEYLEQTCKQYYGAPFREWLRWLAANLTETANRARAMKKEYERTLLPEDSGKQVGRIVDRFALLAVAGELASEAGITGWQPGEAYNAARSCLAAWLNDRGHAANQEEADALEKVRRFITANQYTRFADWYDEKNRPSNMVGFRRVEKGGNGIGMSKKENSGDTVKDGDATKEPETTFYILPSGWKEICGTSDSVKTARLCDEAGWLVKDEDRQRLQRTVRLPEIGLKKVYVFSGEVIG
ncbi:DUF927 domain-containing protein [Escherichia coli]|uniref:DUF927 domain-containing protein n=1 Tax=Escherichia coli TaxID=562 RepID=UPI0013DDFB7B|nr:DUF927 domain-containing protein [Escherichia coli]QIF15541.1 DUF927 domain-containing protein [Escherichia coli]